MCGTTGDVGAVRGTTTVFEVPATEEGWGGVIAQTTELEEKRESKLSGGGPEEAKRKDDSSNTTRRETNKQFMVRSRYRYPLCSKEYPRKTHQQESGANLWGDVAEVFG
jgi:hypothetical protein